MLAEAANNLHPQDHGAERTREEDVSGGLRTNNDSGLRNCSPHLAHLE